MAHQHKYGRGSINTNVEDCPSTCMVGSVKGFMSAMPSGPDYTNAWEFTARKHCGHVIVHSSHGSGTIIATSHSEATERSQRHHGVTMGRNNGGAGRYVHPEPDILSLFSF